MENRIVTKLKDFEKLNEMAVWGEPKLCGKIVKQFDDGTAWVKPKTEEEEKACCNMADICGKAPKEHHLMYLITPKMEVKVIVEMSNDHDEITKITGKGGKEKKFKNKYKEYIDALIDKYSIEKVCEVKYKDEVKEDKDDKKEKEDKEDKTNENYFTYGDKKEPSKKDGEVIKDFDDGYYWIKVKSDLYKKEGETMGNCGRPPEGNVLISLRDPKNLPHVFVAYDTKDKEITQCIGKGNSKPAQKYQKYVDELCKKYKCECK